MATLQDYFDSGDDQNGNAIYGLDGSGHWTGMTFVPSSSYSVTAIAIYIYKVNSPGDVTISLRATTGTPPNGQPSGGDLESATATIPSGDLETSPTWHTATMSSIVGVTSGSQYTITVRCSGDSNNNVRWRMDTAGGYANGNRWESTTGGSSWASAGATNDCLFKVYSTDTYAEGTLTASINFMAEITSEEFAGTWPIVKPDIDPDQVWDEESGAWVTVSNRSAGRYKEQLIAIGQTDTGGGCIYYGDI